MLSTQAGLAANATALRRAHPPESFGGVAGLGATELASCWASERDHCAATFLSWVEQMNRIAATQVYPNVTSGGALSAAYIANAQRVRASRLEPPAERPDRLGALRGDPSLESANQAAR